MMQCGRLDRTELCFKQTAEGHGPAWLSLAAVTVVAGTRGLHPLLMGEGSAVNSPFVLAMRPPPHALMVLIASQLCGNLHPFLIP